MKKLIVLLVAAVFVAGFLAALQIALGDGQYILIVSPDGTAVVQRTDTGAQTDSYQLRGNVTPGNYTLGTDDDSKGIYSVTSSDTTMRPGYFELSLGESALEIAENGVIVNGNHLEWQDAATDSGSREATQPLEAQLPKGE